MVQSVMLARSGRGSAAPASSDAGSSTTTQGSGTPVPAPTGTETPGDGTTPPKTAQHLVGMGYDESDRSKALKRRSPRPSASG